MPALTLLRAPGLVIARASLISRTPDLGPQVCIPHCHCGPDRERHHCRPHEARRHLSIMSEPAHDDEQACRTSARGQPFQDHLAPPGPTGRVEPKVTLTGITGPR